MSVSSYTSHSFPSELVLNSATKTLSFSLKNKTAEKYPFMSKYGHGRIEVSNVLIDAVICSCSKKTLAPDSKTSLYISSKVASLSINSITNSPGSRGLSSRVIANLVPPDMWGSIVPTFR